MQLSECLTFGFEQTFTHPQWWTDPGFVATSDTPLKREKMRQLAQAIANTLGGTLRESVDIYSHLQYETFDQNGNPSFIVTMDPGSIEVKTQPRLFAQIAEEVRPLFSAASESGLVPYREWWYGVRKGTEGGCHVNMAGFTPDTNPWLLDPALVLKYIAFYHNHPELHYPFMGVDVGPGGNSMRMDEHGPSGALSLIKFREIMDLYHRKKLITAGKIVDIFKGTPLAEDRHSAPSLCKYKEPLFMMEDRAVESLRSPEEFELIAAMRLKILEYLKKQDQIEPLLDFGPELHRTHLSHDFLWQQFCKTSLQIGVSSDDYRIFFDRQFPILTAGTSVPTTLLIREGRRPRVITAVQKRGELEISKTVDTSYGRLELSWQASPGQKLVLTVNDQRIEPFVGNSVFFDYRKTDQTRILNFALIDANTDLMVETCCFDLHDMKFTDDALAEPR